MQTAAVQDNIIPVGELITSDEQVSPQTIVNQVAEKFFRTTELDAVAVAEGTEPVGLVTRTKLLFTLFRRFGFELYGKDPVIAIADTAPLIVSETERLDVVIDKALERPPQDSYDEIIVTDDKGRYRGLLSVKQLVIQQGNALAGSILQKEMASERAKELEKINQVKSQFLAHVTHELRSPVNAIIGLTELMRMALDKGAMDQVKKRLSHIISSAAGLRAVVTNVLDLSKIEAKKMEILRERFDLAELVADVSETARVLLGEKPVEVRVAAPDGPLVIESDPMKVRQILMNLAGNAAKFTESGSILFSLSVGGRSVNVSVIDTGIGIKNEHLGRLFTAFSQLEDARTKRHEGTGLGLLISKNLAELLGGGIAVASAFGKGTTFTLTLPYTPLHEPEENDARQAQENHGRG
jgi:signal transduction histidine kinase